VENVKKIHKKMHLRGLVITATICRLMSGRAFNHYRIASKHPKMCEWGMRGNGKASLLGGLSVCMIMSYSLSPSESVWFNSPSQNTDPLQRRQPSVVPHNSETTCNRLWPPNDPLTNDRREASRQLSRRTEHARSC